MVGGGNTIVSYTSYTQQEARYTPVDTGALQEVQFRCIERNAHTNCFYIPNFNTCIYVYNIMRYYNLYCVRERARFRVARFRGNNMKCDVCVTHALYYEHTRSNDNLTKTKKNKKKQPGARDGLHAARGATNNVIRE